ncbi:MAG: BFD-like [2Fe-2S] binding domain [Candidatus Binatota bacterium]|jgi:bacterioferritin-associated ferredoxin|nr:BFD-like [2Fe-2S] binding domain [Candidatus Binatota bacterium]
MILCHCAGVTDRTIERLILDGARSVDDVTRACGAGASCAPCRDEILGLLYALGTPSHNRHDHESLPARKRAA